MPPIQAPEDEQTIQETEVVETEETEEAADEDSQNVSEDEETPEDDADEDGSDRTVPLAHLKREREKRQAAEARARELEEAKKGDTQTQTRTENVLPDAPAYPNTSRGIVRYELDLDKAQDKWPELKSNRAFQRAVTGYIRDGLTVMEAADEFFTEIGKTAKAARVEGVKATKVTASNKSQASTAEGGAAVVSDELTELQEKINASTDPAERRRLTERKMSLKYGK